MTEFRSYMEQEVREAPEAVRRQAAALFHPLRELVARLKSRPPDLVMTCARGSSAHAATFGKHLIERYLGIPVAAAAPSISSVYGRPLRLRDQLFLVASQSGMSDDIVEATKAAKRSGALTAAIVNADDSPLATISDIVLPMGAGPERSVAATKTFIATLTVLLRLAAAWNDDGALQDAVDRLPARLRAALDFDWSPILELLSAPRSLVTIGRGPTLAIAREAALKLKENCNLHAEAFSGAEFLHGPVALVSTDYPILVFMPTDVAADGLQQLVTALRNKGAAVWMTAAGEPAGGQLAALPDDHPETDAVCLMQTFYMMAQRLAARLGTDVDRPRHLRKVTRTR